MDKSKFVRDFLANYGFYGDSARLFAGVDDLSPEYPVMLIKAPGVQAIGLYDELADAKDALAELPADASMDDIMRLLFTEGTVEWQSETVYVYLLSEQIGAPDILPKEYAFRPIADTADVEILASALTLQERLESLPWDTDEDFMGIYRGTDLVAACGATRCVGYYDIAICVHPEHRGKKLARHMLQYLAYRRPDAALCYRTRENNSPSMHLAQKMGMQRVLTYYGAFVRYLDI